ncbi:MAG TPA: hypothetical protein ENJ54_09815 [Chloroflexi bacterium]|nr:hypothetical protein [Chloroflexota bacterium]
MPLGDVRQQALQDLLDAERELRAHAEGELRRLRDLLYGLARALDGDRVEQIRRDDPRAFRYWNAQQYEEFFAPLIAAQQWHTVRNQPTGWGNKTANGNGNGRKADAEKIRQLEGEIARLKQQLEDTRRHAADLAAQLREVNRRDSAAQPLQEPKVQPKPKGQSREAAFDKAANARGKQPSKKPPAQRKKTAAVTPRALPVRDEIIAALRQIRKQPPAIPARVEHLFSSSVIGRTRQIMALYLLALQGITPRIELDYYIAATDGIKKRSGGVRRKLDALQEKGIITAKKLVINTPRTSLVVMRLTDEGKRIAEQIFMQPPVESEWERLVRLHEGERFPAHTAAVLLFAMYARLQGYSVSVLPEVESPSPPDILIARANERLFVEVELGRKERPAKWKYNAELNGGKIALVTGTANRREVLTADIQRMGLPGVATDLEYLLQKGRNEEAPLWIAQW